MAHIHDSGCIHTFPDCAEPAGEQFVKDIAALLALADALAAAVKQYDGTIVTRQAMFDAAHRYQGARSA